MNAPRATLPMSISAVAASRFWPGKAPLPGGVDISIALSLKMAPGLREPRCEKIAHTHQVVAGEGQERGELDLPAASHLRSPQKSVSFAQPKDSSMRLRALMLRAYPGWRVVRALIAEPPRRSRFCARFGVTFSSRVCRTNSRVS